MAEKQAVPSPPSKQISRLALATIAAAPTDGQWLAAPLYNTSGVALQHLLLLHVTSANNYY